MKNKKIILAAIALVLVAATMLAVYFITRPKPQEGQKNITVTVLHSSGQKKVFSYTTDGDYLGPVLEEAGLIVMDDEQKTMFSTVDGEKAVWAENNSYWALYVDGQYAMVGINEVPLQDGGSYKLVYTIGW